ncbi:MAG: CBS domain-containing protein [Candidatus Heimdallarchaeota archaeon]
MDSPVFVNEEDNILTVIKRLLQTAKGYVLVNRSNKTVGIISDRDIQRLILEKGGMFSPALIARDFMITPVIKCTKSTSLYDAEALMQRNKVNRLPVVENDGSKVVIGIINFDTIHSNLLTNFAKSWIKRKEH